MLKISPLGTEIQADFHFEKLRLQITFDCDITVLVRTDNQKFSTKAVRFDLATSTAEINQTLRTRFSVYPLARPIQIRVYLIKSGQQKEAGKIQLNVNQAIEEKQLSFQLPLENCLTASRLYFSFTYQFPAPQLNSPPPIMSKYNKDGEGEPKLLEFRERTRTDPSTGRNQPELNQDSSLGTSFQEHLNSSHATSMNQGPGSFSLLSVQSHVVRARSRSPYNKPIGNIQLNFGTQGGEPKKGLNKSFNGEGSGSKTDYPNQRNVELNTSQPVDVADPKSTDQKRKEGLPNSELLEKGDKLLSINIPIPTTLPLDFSDNEAQETSRKSSTENKGDVSTNKRIPFIPDLLKPEIQSGKRDLLSPNNSPDGWNQSSRANSQKSQNHHEHDNQLAENEAEQQYLTSSANKNAAEAQQMLDRLAAKLQKDINAKNTENKELRDQIEKLRAELEPLKSTGLDHEKLSDEHRRTLAELEEERQINNRLQEQLIKLSSQHADEKALNDLRSTLEDSKSLLSQKERELTFFQIEQTKKHDLLFGQLKTSEERIRELQDELLSSTEREESGRKQLIENLEANKEELQRLTKQLAEQKAACDTQEFEISRFHIEVTGLEAKIKIQAAELEAANTLLAERPALETTPQNFGGKKLAFGSDSRMSSTDDVELHQAELLGLKKELIEKEEELNRLERRNFELENDLKVFKHMKHSVCLSGQ